MPGQGQCQRCPAVQWPSDQRWLLLLLLLPGRPLQHAHATQPRSRGESTNDQRKHTMRPNTGADCPATLTGRLRSPRKCKTTKGRLGLGEVLIQTEMMLWEQTRRQKQADRWDVCCSTI